MHHNILLFFYLITFLGYGESSNCKGCVSLDSYCFDKITSKFQATLVKFDVPYPYGEKHEEFGKVSESVRDVSELLVAEIGVKDYGDKDNTDLAERFGVSKDDFPVVKLLKPGSEPITYSGDFKAENLLTFIRKNSDVYVGLPGCLAEFDQLAVQFSAAATQEKKKKILRQTEDVWDTVKGASNQKSAEVYVKTMRKVLEKDGFVDTEIKRVENVIKGKISKEKASEMQVRLNILKSFQMGSTIKDEF